MSSLDFWMIELIVLTYVNAKMFKCQIYRHQKFLIYLNLIPIILKIYPIKTIIDNDKHEKETNKYLRDDEKGLRVIYIVYNWLIPIGLIIYFFFILARSYVNCKIKWLMDLKYISEYKILMLYGFVGFLFCLILCIILTFIDCGYKDEVDFGHYYCGVDYEGKIYYDNFIEYFTSFDSAENRIYEIISLIFGVIIFIFYKYYNIKVIQVLTPMHFVFITPATYFLEKFFLMINTKIRKDSVFSPDAIDDIKTKFSLDVTGDSFTIIIFLIYLEIIELRFCGLNEFLKDNIIKRGIHEVNDSIEYELYDSRVDEFE